MIAKEAVVVFVDFDGDFSFQGEGWNVFVGNEAAQEAKDFTKKALTALNEYYKRTRHRGIAAMIDEENREEYVENICHDDELLNTFMRQGGDRFYNWKVEVHIVGLDLFFAKKSAY